MHNEIEARVKKAIEERVFPGCVVGVVRSNGEREVLPFGNFTYEADSPVVREDTIYDVASITKSIPTASLALHYISEGTLELSDLVKKYLPELQNDYGATIEHLLTYAVHGVQMSTLKNKTPDELTAHVFAHGFDGPPGKSRYTNLPAFLLGLIMERVGGDTLDALAQKRFFHPLRMRRTTFFPNVGRYDLPTSVAPTEIDAGREVRGIVHDESARVFAKTFRAVGHAGLFSTVPDILTFLEALLQGNYPNIVEGAQKGLGWQTEGPFLGSQAGGHAFGKTGFTGTSVCLDIERGIAFVILSNRTFPKRPKHDDAIYRFRSDIADIVLK